MKTFAGRTAVVTGAASGIGFALAQRCATLGMNVVMADVEEASLQSAAQAIGADEKKLLPVRVDVSRAEDVEKLAAKAIATFGKVHVLCNNAGVTGVGKVWEMSLDDWQWVLGVNLWGVIHGLRAFLPAMLAHGEEGHIVNTASAVALAARTSTAYDVAKFGVTGLTEGLAADLHQTTIGVSLLCPGAVETRILDAERNRPETLSNKGFVSSAAVESRAFIANRKDRYPPASIADLVVKAMETNQFYVLPMQSDFKLPILNRLRDLGAALDRAPEKL